MLAEQPDQRRRAWRPDPALVPGTPLRSSCATSPPRRSRPVTSLATSSITAPAGARRQRPGADDRRRPTGTSGREFDEPDTFRHPPHACSSTCAFGYGISTSAWAATSPALEGRVALEEVLKRSSPPGRSTSGSRPCGHIRRPSAGWESLPVVVPSQVAVPGEDRLCPAGRPAVRSPDSRAPVPCRRPALGARAPTGRARGCATVRPSGSRKGRAGRGPRSTADIGRIQEPAPSVCERLPGPKHRLAVGPVAGDQPDASRRTAGTPPSETTSCHRQPRRRRRTRPSSAASPMRAIAGDGDPDLRATRRCARHRRPIEPELLYQRARPACLNDEVGPPDQLVQRSGRPARCLQVEGDRDRFPPVQEVERNAGEPRRAASGRCVDSTFTTLPAAGAGRKCTARVAPPRAPTGRRRHMPLASGRGDASPRRHDRSTPGATR